MRTWWLGLGVAALVWMGCAPTAPGAACTPGVSQACTCVNGRAGAQSCNTSGSGFGACVCALADGGTSCSPNCAGRGCGDNGCGGTCGQCPTGLVCNEAQGRCVSSCTPNCGGRGCGPDGCGGSCGSCNAGFSCNAAGGCVAGCTRAVGATCSTDRECCDDQGVPTRCVSSLGWGTLCSATCARNSDCVSGCCVTLTDGTHACGSSLLCASHSACTRQVGQSCGSDADCCPQTDSVPTVCSCFGSNCSCRSICASNSGCQSGCCQARTDGILNCVPAANCQ